ncbi:acetyl-CoA synthetase-like protein [Mycena galopus ATCC 62051]|nr:acetyl-CoA synthetase-like protein [Mycena galopus ATCC 62051]
MANFLPPLLEFSLNAAEIFNLHIAHDNQSAAYSWADEEGRITDVSHFEVARAAHRVAQILRPQRGGPDGQVMAIVALTDVLIYQTIVAGCLIAGLVPFPIFHRNSPAAITHLLTTAGSHRLLTTKNSLGYLLNPVSADFSRMDPPYTLSIEEIPLLGQLYPHLGHETNEHPFKPYPSGTARMDDLALYLHSSGSTGLPKCIPQTHRSIIQLAALGALPQIPELSSRQAVGILPPAHMFGFGCQLLSPMLNNATVCIFPPASTRTEYMMPLVPSSRAAIENSKRTNATAIFAVPSMIADWQSPEDVAYLKTLNMVVYGGGPLPYDVGEFLFKQGIRIIPVYAGSEFGTMTILERHQVDLDDGDWNWLRFDQRVNIRWVSQEDGTFECQVLNVPGTHQVAVENLPDTKGYATKDLFERHPTKSDLWKIVGRLDDVLIMANGEKTVPGPMEDIMLASQFITGAVVFGRERNQIGVLIEPAQQYEIDPTDEQQVLNFRNLIWPVIEQANENAPAFSRIFKEMVIVTQPGKPMVHTTKGNVSKKATFGLYKEEVEQLYDNIETSGNAAGDVEAPSSWSSQGLEPWLQTHASLVADRNILEGQDLFDQGFDSLNATFLRHRIVGALRNSDHTAAAQNIPENFVYAHPTIEQLTSAIMALVHGDANGCHDGRVAVEAMIAKYSAGLEAPLNLGGNHVALSDETIASSSGTVILLTGSTGGLGSHILETLLSLSSIHRVYAFNRGGRIPVSERQKEAFVDRALDATLLSSEKLVYLEGDTSKADLELPPDVWTTLRDTVTVIIHNAWTLDFNKTLSSFEPHVKGMRNLIDLARQSPNESGVRFLFTSSIGSAIGWDQKLGPFPEELQLDANVAVGNGYGESKYVSERILAASGLDATSFRIGQLSGSTTNGAWATSDWVPAMVKSSIALGNFPSDPSGAVAWLPPAAVSRTIIDAALITESPPFAVNLVHPRSVPWDFVMSAMASETHLPLIPFADWVQQLQDCSAQATADDIANIPGIKLLGFFNATLSKGNTEFFTLKAQAMSQSMKSLNSLKEDDVKQWMNYWRKKKFIV